MTLTLMQNWLNCNRSSSVLCFYVFWFLYWTWNYMAALSLWAFWFCMLILFTYFLLSHAYMILTMNIEFRFPNFEWILCFVIMKCCKLYVKVLWCLNDMLYPYFHMNVMYIWEFPYILNFPYILYSRPRCHPLVVPKLGKKNCRPGNSSPCPWPENLGQH